MTATPLDLSAVLGNSKAGRPFGTDGLVAVTQTLRGPMWSDVVQSRPDIWRCLAL